MDVTPLISSNNSVVQSYGANGFKISGKSYDHPIYMTTTDVQDWPSDGFDTLTFDHFKNIIADKPDVLFIGTGTAMRHIPAPLKAELKEAGLNVETMDTGAACRTFNVLMSDGRNIAAILYIPQ